jgi:hypothetical protein
MPTVWMLIMSMAVSIPNFSTRQQLFVMLTSILVLIELECLAVTVSLLIDLDFQLTFTVVVQLIKQLHSS